MLDQTQDVVRSTAAAGADICFYCHSSNLKHSYGGQFHKRKKDHGPFDLYQCCNCGSLLTLPPPSPEALSALYSSFQFGLSQLSRQLLSENPEAVWHEECAKRLIQLSRRSSSDSFTWIDVGAGGGELARLLASHFPAARGLALDIHDRPPSLEGATNVDWLRTDIAQDAFAATLGVKADLVFATGVWEHVRRPDVFARNVLSLLNAGGVLYFTTPNYGSITRRIMGANWPYFIPGEHLCMPTPKGAQLCLQRELAELSNRSSEAVVTARPILVRYGVRFVLAKLNMTVLARMVPSSFFAHIPSGAMESVVRLPQDEKK